MPGWLFERTKQDRKLLDRPRGNSGPSVERVIRFDSDSKSAVAVAQTPAKEVLIAGH